MWTPGGQPDRLTFAGLRKGGGPSPPPPTYQDPVTGMVYMDPYSLNAAIQQRTQTAQQKSEADAATAAAKAQSDEADFQTRRDAARSDARASVEQAFRDAGVDPSQYSQYIDPTISRYYNSIQDLSPNPSGAFPSTIGADVVNQATTAARNSATRAFNQAFTPTYAQTNLADTSVDPYVNQIVGEQFDPLMSQLQNAQKRGTLTDTGYQAAMDAYNSKRSAATDTVRGLAMNVLGTERGALNDYITQARGQAGNINLGDQYSVDPYAQQARSMVQSDISGLGGAIRSAVGDTKFAQLPDLLSAGGVVQGPNNPAATNPAMADPNAAAGIASSILDDSKKRGLGSSGAF